MSSLCDLVRCDPSKRSDGKIEVVAGMDQAWMGADVTVSDTRRAHSKRMRNVSAAGERMTEEYSLWR